MTDEKQLELEKKTEPDPSANLEPKNKKQTSDEDAESSQKVSAETESKGSDLDHILMMMGPKMIQFQNPSQQGKPLKNCPK